MPLPRHRAGGIRAIYPPGHSPGHTVLRCERAHTLIGGDALRTGS